MPSSNIDIVSPNIYEQGVPHERFAQLRRECPVYWHEEPDGPGFWAITRYADALTVLKDTKTYSSEVAGTQIPNLPETDMRRSPDVLAVMDPPRHTRYRALVAQSFTRRGLSSMNDYILQLVGELLDDLVQRDRFDFVEDFAAKLPMTTILTMVGVPMDAQAQVNDWVLRLLATDDPEYATSDEERHAIVGCFMEYAHSLAAERRKHPKDDLLSMLMEAEVDGAKLTYEEFGMFFMLLLAAGTDSPRLILGSGMLTLMQQPELHARLSAEPRYLGPMVEEVLRFHPPLMHFRRTATRDVVLRGQKISEGDKVVVWLVSANRDEEVFPNPDLFDIDRASNDHVAFGYGPHFCIGNALARMSTKIALGECVRRLPRLTLAGPVERVRSNWFNGMKRMPVTVG